MRISKNVSTTVEASTKKVFDSHGQDTQLNDRSGQVVEVIRPLTEDEADLFDVGPMYRIRFDDGYETDAFEDELSDEITSCNASVASVVSNTDISKMSTTELFNYIHDNMKESFAPEGNWIRKFCDVSGISKDDADANYWHNTEIPNNPTANRKIIDYLKGVDACEDIKASTSTDKALKYIKAAIDVLGKSGNKDAVTKDSIANLATVMFDIKSSNKGDK